MIEIGVGAKALVTGAASGIGAIYAHRLAQRGFDLILAARDGERLTPFARWIRDQGKRRVDTLSLDLSDAADLARLEERLRRDAELRIFVNNAGLGAIHALPFDATGGAEAMIALNHGAPARLAYAAAAAFGARGGGAIVNVATLAAGAAGRRRRSEDTVIDFFTALGTTLETELGAYGVRAQLVVPDASAGRLWELAGADVQRLPREIVLIAEDMVDQALRGLDEGEAITRPKAPRTADWAPFEGWSARGSTASAAG